jgi:hypothetical protein
VAARRDKPHQRLVKTNRSPVRDARRQQSYDPASHHATRNRCALIAALDLQFASSAWKKPEVCFDQRSVNRDVDDRRFVTGTYACPLDAKFSDPTGPCR